MTNTFLLEEGLHPPSWQKLHRAVEDHQASFTKLKRQLLEAQTEWHFSIQLPNITDDGTQRNSRAKSYQDAVDSLNRLGQHLNGLRGGTRLQYQLTQAGVLGPHSGRDEADDKETAQLKAAAAMFDDLLIEVGRPLKALTVRLFSKCSLSVTFI